MKMKVRVQRWIRRNYGRRCEDEDLACIVCQTYHCFDVLFNNKELFGTNSFVHEGLTKKIKFIIKKE